MQTPQRGEGEPRRGESAGASMHQTPAAPGTRPGSAGGGEGRGGPEAGSRAAGTGGEGRAAAEPGGGPQAWGRRYEWWQALEA